MFGVTKSKESDKEWKEFPWEEIIVKNDIKKKWNVDMREIYHLHANFDTETGKFTIYLP